MTPYASTKSKIPDSAAANEGIAPKRKIAMVGFSSIAIVAGTIRNKTKLITSNINLNIRFRRYSILIYFMLLAIVS